MKRVFAIVLAICLSFGMAFAARQGDMKVGAQVGYGQHTINFKGSNGYSRTDNGGFYFAGTSEYAFSKTLSGKVGLGINTMGRDEWSWKLGSISYNTSGSSNSPTLFSTYVGACYGLEVSKKAALYVGAGFDALVGKESNADDARTNAAMGLGLELTGAYKLEKNLELTVGAKFGWYFINSDKDIDEYYSKLSENDITPSHTAFKVFAGATYTL